MSPASASGTSPTAKPAKPETTPSYTRSRRCGSSRVAARGLGAHHWIASRLDELLLAPNLERPLPLHLVAPVVAVLRLHPAALPGPVGLAASWRRCENLRVVIARIVQVACLGLAIAVAPANATFRGQNGLLAYTALGGPGSIGAVASSDGSGAVTLVPSGSNPAWSPDGRRLAYQEAGDLYVANADGTNVDRLARPRTDECDPSWSPTGRRIVFVLAEDCSAEFGAWIATVRPDGTGLRRLIRTNALFFQPAWSPEARRSPMSVSMSRIWSTPTSTSV
jgi:WD40-like Beta Propeller Repeat